MDISKYIAKLPEKNHTLILGGSGGIGSEVVRAFAANGGNLTIGFGSNIKQAEALKAEIEPLGVKVHLAHIDRDTPEAFNKILEEAVQATGLEITGLVDAIGISPNITLKDQTYEDWVKVFKVNVWGAFVSARAMAYRMKEKKVKGGTILLFGSTNGMNSHAPISLPYDLSKRDVHGMVESLAEEFALDGIRILGIAPGWIDTGMNDTLPPGMYEREINFTYMGRLGKPEEIAKSTYLMVTDGFSFATGTVYKVDGGYPRRNPPHVQVPAQK